MEEGIHVRLSKFLHTLRVRWASAVLNHCYDVEHQDGSLLIPRDLEKRLLSIIESSFSSLPNNDRAQCILEASELLDILEEWRFGVDGLHLVHSYSSYDDDEVSFTSTSPAQVTWESTEFMSESGNVGVHTDESGGYTVIMTNEERVALESAMQRSYEESVLNFSSIDTRKIPGRGVVKTVKVDSELATRLPGLTGGSVVIDGENWVIRHIECFLPIKEGDTVGFAVREPRDEERLHYCREHGWVNRGGNGVMECPFCENDALSSYVLKVVEGSDD